MFLKKYYLSKSKIHGIGLFAGENIEKGRIIWTPSKMLSFRFTNEQLQKLPLQEQETIRHYGYFHKFHRIWHFSSEDSRHINHSRNPNAEKLSNGDGVRAKNKIKKGEEITQDYNDFEELRKELLIT